jgi:hypothetical protein
VLLLESLALPSPKGVGHALFFGFAAALLGISGFESSAHFIEEQQGGVPQRSCATCGSPWPASTP